METKALLRFLLPVAVGLATASAATVQTSDIQGLLRVSAPANTDTIVSPVFSRTPVWSGAVQTVSGNRVTVAGTPGWTTNQFTPGADTYYVRARGGALNGLFFTVVSNDATSIVLDNAGFSLSQFTAGDSLELVPYWTLGALYPASQAGVGFIASASSLIHQTEVLTYDASGTGINRSPNAVYFYFNGAWRKTGAAVVTSFNALVLPPDSYVLQRNKASATTLTQLGRVHPGRVSTVVEALASARQDNYLALAFPVDVTLLRTGLAGSVAFATSTSPLLHADELLVYDPTQTGINKSPSAVYYYYNGGWRKTGAAVTTDFASSVTIPAGTGFIIRKAAAGTTGPWNFDTNL